MRVYLAGPMRGLPELNYPAFDANRDFLKELGHDPVSPADLDRASGVNIETAYEADVVAGALRRDFAALVTCDAIAFLPGWKNSVGATAERRVAEDIGLAIYDSDFAARRFELQSESWTIIGLSGYARSGKDTVAGFLADHGYERVAFADILREALLVLDPYICSDHDGPLSLIVEQFGWEKAKADPAVRALLQRMGTDVGRNMIDDNLWVKLALRKLEPGHKYVFTDVRFPNEANALRNVGGQMWRVERPGHGPINGHVSETALDDYDMDLTIGNGGDLDDLKFIIELGLQAKVG